MIIGVHLFVIPAEFSYLLSMGVALLCFWRGSLEARIIGGLQLLVATFVKVLCFQTACWNGHLLVQPWRPLVEDSLLLAGCLYCMWRSRRAWVIVASAFALLSVGMDCLYLLIDTPPLWAIGSANLIWWYGLLAVTAWGALTDHRAASVPAAAVESAPAR